MSRVVTAVDTNILLYALNAQAPECLAARSFLEARKDDPDFVLSELVLVELYALLRNAAVVKSPLGPPEAAAVIAQLRRHPRWRLLDHDAACMDAVWYDAAQPGFARTRIFDSRLARGLLCQGVTHFATRNVRHFTGLGFTSVWDPLGEP